MLFYIHTHTTISITKCTLVSLGPKHGSATNIPLREISSMSLCALSYSSPTWPYKSIIKVQICPIHFCVSCTYFVCGVCIGSLKGTHEKIYTVGLGSCFFALSGIAITSFSPGSLPNNSLLHCRLIQCRLFFFFCITVPHSW
jgi:hypothetical protein